MSDMINGCEVIAQKYTPAAPMTRSGRFILAKVKKENCFVDDDGKTQDEWVTAWQGSGDDSWIEGHYFRDQVLAEQDFVMRAYPDLRRAISKFLDGMEHANKNGSTIADSFDLFLCDVKKAIFRAVSEKENGQLVCPVCFDTVQKGDPMNTEGTMCDGPGDSSTHADTVMVSVDKAATKAAAIKAAMVKLVSACDDTVQGAAIAMITIHTDDANSSIEHSDIDTATLHLAKANKVASAVVKLQGAVTEAIEVLK